MKFHCPHCNQALTADMTLAASVVPCPACNKKFEIPAEFAQQDAAEQAAVAAAAPQQAAAGAQPGPVPKVKVKAKMAGGKGKLASHADGTNVSPLWTGVWGLGATILHYLVLWPVHNSYLGALFIHRGWVPPVETLLFWWAVAILVFKYRKLEKQRRGMLFDLLPDEVGREISQANVEKFMEHIWKLPVKPNESFLVTRVLRGLEHFRIRNNNSEVAGVLGSQSDIDGNAVGSSYALLKVFIWAIPILGFIGTVQGLGSAVGGFASGLDAAADISVVKGALNKITIGLAVAFDTTLLALIMSLPLMFVMSSWQKAEDDLLNQIDEYCNENLLRRLRDFGGPEEKEDAVTGANIHQVVQNAVNAAMAGHHVELQMYFQRLEAVGETLRHHAAEGFKQAQDQWLAARAEDLNKITEALQNISERQIETMKHVQASMETASKTAEQSSKVAAASEQRLTAVTRAAEGLNRHLDGVERVVSSFNNVLGKFGEKQIVIQPPPRRLFGFLRRGNGEKGNG
jgi:biopolymer transport protein ExbB/TolQ